MILSRIHVCGVTLALLGASCTAMAEEGSGAARRALLVGCTTYDNNPRRSLKGSANDVDLMHELLVDKFGFRKDDVHRLSEATGRQGRPIRAAIVREMGSLIRSTGRGDQVVLYFAGHGSQQPDQPQGQPGSDEPDGLDEIFLPADVGQWTDKHTVENAIIDDELHGWVGALLDKGARVLVIMDACHSGSGIRGDVSDEISRQFPLEELLIPDDLLATARGRAKPADELEPSLDPLDRGDWVALYAAQPNQTTSESPARRPQANQREMSGEEYYGLFTYTLCQALQRNHAPSYQELMEVVRGLYKAGGRFEPTPAIEGKDLDRKFLGADRLPLAFRLERDGKDWHVSAGQLHGLTEGSILAVHRPGDDQRAEPSAHVRVLQAGIHQSIVEPCVFTSLQKVFPKVDRLPPGGVCRVAYLEYGDFRLPIAVDPTAINSGAGMDELRTWLAEIEKRSGSPIRVVSDPREAHWLLVPVVDKRRQWMLVPRSSLQIENRDPRTADRRPPNGSRVPRPEVTLIAESADSLRDQLFAVARVQNLLLVSERSREAAADDDEPLQVELELWRIPAGSTDGAPEKLPSRDVPAFQGGDRGKNSGDKLQFRVVNRGPRQRVDFTLLFIDSRFGVEPIYPRKFSDFNRLEPGQEYVKVVPVLADTIGLESVLLIAVPAQRGEPIDFKFLAQKGVGSASSSVAQHRGGAEHVLPLDRLLESAALFSGTTRGIGLGGSTNQYTMQVRDWVVRPYQPEAQAR